tara:strand:- start:4188 stop:5084 length:897 start_codon:yes stop_codon:yes gene_type:complete
MEKPLSIVIFSKDRAAQLDLCLKSIHENLKGFSRSWDIYIIHTSESEDFERGYSDLKKEWEKPFIHFFAESEYGGFKETLQEVVQRSGEYILFFTDDDIVYRNLEYDFDLVDDKFKTSGSLLTIGLRLGSNTFVQDQYQNTICFIPDGIILQDEPIKEWDWKFYCLQYGATSFGYPFSVDGHIYRTKTVKWIIENTPGHYNPNSLEGAVHRLHIMETEYAENLTHKMGCFKKSHVINTPLNRVQETFTNSAGKFFGNTAKELNDRFLEGYRLSLEGMDFSTIIGVHQELKLCWGEKCS